MNQNMYIKQTAQILIVVVLFFATKAQAELRIAHVSSDEVLVSMPAYPGVEKTLKEFNENLTNKLKTMQTEFDKKYLEYTKTENTMTQSVRELLFGEVRELEIRIQEFAATAEESYQLKQEELLQPLLEEIQKIIASVAKDNNIDYVLETNNNGLLFVNDDRDILPLIKAKIESDK